MLRRKSLGVAAQVAVALAVFKFTQTRIQSNGGPHMKFVRLIVLTSSCVLLASSLAGARGYPPSDGPAGVSWFFTVSGDSRDCGNLIMPLIAQDIFNQHKSFPVSFYWHLGDLRAIYRIDCDWGMRTQSLSQCPPKAFANPRSPTPVETEYLGASWKDFIDNEVRPFEKANVPFVLGIGNHELIWPKTRDEFRFQFKEWLTAPMLEEQRRADLIRNIFADPGDTYFHFVMKGVDFIYLDNADPYVGFSAEQLAWLHDILKADATDTTIKSIIVGMHEALPYSKSRYHGMDDSCAGRCTGTIAYDMLYNTQKAGKHVYVLASHSHRFEKDIFKGQVELQGHELDGWIVGTAGAEQYRDPTDPKDKLSYGYMRVEVKPDGRIEGRYMEVKPDGASNLSGDWVKPLTEFCFQKNKRALPEARKVSCNCTQPQ